MIDSGKISKPMEVIAADGRRIGFVSRLAGDRLRLTSLSGSHGYDHLIPLAWVSGVDRYVYLNRPSRFVADNWENVAITPDRRSPDAMSFGRPDPAFMRPEAA